MRKEYEHLVSDSVRSNVAHPYMEGLIPVGLLFGCFALLAATAAGLVVAGLTTHMWLIPAGINLFIWGLILVALWVWGFFKLQKIKNFMKSSRALIHWWYTPDEWHVIQKQYIKEQTGVSARPGCLGPIFAFVGAIVGVVGGIVGVFVGALIGGGLGATLALGNQLSYRWVKRFDRQNYVALGATEILHRRSYFRSNGNWRYIKNITLEDATKDSAFAALKDSTFAALIVEVCNPKPRGDADETWSIPVPERVVPSLRDMLPQIRTGHF